LLSTPDNNLVGRLGHTEWRRTQARSRLARPTAYKLPNTRRSKKRQRPLPPVSTHRTEENFGELTCFSGFSDFWGFGCARSKIDKKTK
jgi:hypothetical protein